MSENRNIVCPHCKKSFDIEEALSHQLEEEYQKQFEKKAQELSQQVAAEYEKMKEERKKLEKEKKEQDIHIHTQIEAKMKEEKRIITEEATQKMQGKIKLLEEEAKKKEQENLALQQKELELMKNTRELEAKQKRQKIEMEQELFKRQTEIENKLKTSWEQERAKELETHKLREAELQKKLDDSVRSAEELKKKAEQGSTQLQGEIQELALEEMLKNAFPLDSIEEVPKGARGADCLQIVRNTQQQECGSIIYESKRTKTYSKEWISKLKQDQIRCKADIAILVTQAMPSDMNESGKHEGIWICHFHDTKALTMVLRDSLIRIHEAYHTQVNKGEKMELLYTYLSSSEFVNIVKRIVDTYQHTLEQLNKEKRAMQSIWKEREKAIEIAQESLSLFFGSVKGIMGNSLDNKGVLELGNDQLTIDS